MTEQKFFSPEDLALRWGISPGTLANWRCYGGGPEYQKIGGRVRYSKNEVIAFEERRGLDRRPQHE